MHRFLICFGILTAGCDAPPRTVYVNPPISQDLRLPCLTPPMRAATEGQLAAKVLRIAADRDCANAKIIAVDQILTASEPPQQQGKPTWQ